MLTSSLFAPVKDKEFVRRRIMVVLCSLQAALNLFYTPNLIFSEWRAFGLANYLSHLQGYAPSKSLNGR